ncbi:MAG: sigma-70 family RNA polymerase sigma factor [Roseiflexaceae bacterium]
MVAFSYVQQRADNLWGSAPTSHESAANDAICYDLFRRAIEQRDADAWADIIRQYRGLLAAWATQSSARGLLSEQPEDIADQAFARAWAALSSARFSSFPHIASLLAYLRSCVRTTMIDHAREQAGQLRAVQNIVSAVVAAAPEHAVLEELDRTDIWRLIARMTSNPQEQVIVRECLVYALPPREIHARHPDMFAHVMQVYRVKRNLINRFQRNRDLQRLWQERDAS